MVGIVGRLADLRGAQYRGQLRDAALHLSLFLAGGVIAAVLGQVALFAGSGDLGGHSRPADSLEVVQFGREQIVRVPGQPHRLLFNHRTILASVEQTPHSDP